MQFDFLNHEAFALIQRGDSDKVLAIAGSRSDLSKISEITVGERLVLVPFAQIAERGFDVHDDQTPLSEIQINYRADYAVTEIINQLPHVEIEYENPGGFEISDDDYANLVSEVIENEIGQGEGANVVIARRFTAKIKDWNFEKALSVFAQLLKQERGSYWTFLIFTGDRYLIGASPERHVSVDAKTVRMNPISGTFRLSDIEGDPKKALVDFLNHEKEIFELFMVVDEELKMMCDICNEGGLVLGPYLKPMSQVIHTEYLLAGRTHRDVREVLRDSMFAATVTGSPVESACRLIKKYEKHGRGYYSAVAALMGTDENGMQYLDAPILIRTAEIDLAGNLSISAGATLVRDSDPVSETKETSAKISAILRAFGATDPKPESALKVDSLLRSDEVLIALGSRNQRLSQFWLTDQSNTPPRPSLLGKKVVILDAEDDFVNMLSHAFGVLGMETAIISYDQYQPGDFADFDLVVIGPGPGDPRDEADPKIATITKIVQEQLAHNKPMFAVCLGHQVLCKEIGLDLDYKNIIFQGTQSVLPVNGQNETVGFYNTFVAKVPASGLSADVSVETDGADVHLVKGPHFTGVQFHAESILSQHGDRIIGDIVEDLLRRTSK